MLKSFAAVRCFIHVFFLPLSQAGSVLELVWWKFVINDTVAADAKYDSSVLKFSNRRFLFLRGPEGSFFYRLRCRLQNIGYCAYFINVSGSDFADRPCFTDSFWYRDIPQNWSSYLEKVVTEKNITDIVLHGSSDFYNAAAVDLSEALGIRIWIFEESSRFPGSAVLLHNTPAAKNLIYTVCTGAEEKNCGEGGAPNFLSGTADSSPSSGKRRFVYLRRFLGSFLLAPFFRHFSKMSSAAVGEILPSEKKVSDEDIILKGDFYSRDGIERLVRCSLRRMGMGGIANCIFFSRGITQIRNLRVFLDCVEDTAVVGWGYKPTAARARKFARTGGLAYYALEDSFIRSLATEYRGSDDEILGLVLDRTGIYYNVDSSSQLEEYMVHSGDWYTGELRERAGNLIKTIVSARIVKYNSVHEPPPGDFLPDNIPQNAVLVIDQTLNDASIPQGNADAESFRLMLREAVEKAGPGNVYVKEHPNVSVSMGRGYFSIPDLKKLGVNIITAPVNSIELLLKFRNVYVVTSGTGFEALMCGCSVTCFGEPFYSGYGLTDDRKSKARRKRGERMNSPATVEMLAAAVFYRYSIFVHPENCRTCSPEEALEYIISKKQNSAGEYDGA